MKGPRPTEIVNGPDDLAKRAAEIFIERALLAITKNQRFTLALSGGKTPKAMFQILCSPACRDRVDWDKVFIFWGDERMVPHNDPDSNYRMAHEEFLGKVPIPQKNIFRVPTEEGEAKDVALKYQTLLHQFFGTEEPTPHFDLVFLGMGADGHTASLFPDSNFVAESHDPKTLVIAPKVQHLKAFRISLTLRVINNARYVVFLVAGADKAEMIRKIFEEEQPFPAGLVHPTRGELLWVLDSAAASKLRISKAKN